MIDMYGAYVFFQGKFDMQMPVEEGRMILKKIQELSKN